MILGAWRAVLVPFRNDDCIVANARPLPFSGILIVNLLIIRVRAGSGHERFAINQSAKPAITLVPQSKIPNSKTHPNLIMVKWWIIVRSLLLHWGGLAMLRIIVRS